MMSTFISKGISIDEQCSKQNKKGKDLHLCVELCFGFSKFLLKKYENLPN